MTQPAVSGVFAVPLFSRVWPETAAVNAELKQMILARAPAPGPQAYSNVGGWHSAADLHSWGGAAVHQLTQWIGAATREMSAATSGSAQYDGDFTLWAWANLLRKGGYNMAHDHSRAGWSGVYYVETGQESPTNPLAGQIEFIDPRLGASSQHLPGKPFDNPVRIKPQDGLMLVFPGWFKHFVHPYEGESERISIAFNLIYQPPDETGSG